MFFFPLSYSENSLYLLRILVLYIFLTHIFLTFVLVGVFFAPWILNAACGAVTPYVAPPRHSVWSEDFVGPHSLGVNAAAEQEGKNPVSHSSVSALALKAGLCHCRRHS